MPSIDGPESVDGPKRVIEHGKIIFSPRVATLALDLIVNPIALLTRHLRGEWGNIPLPYAIANNFFLRSKERVQSRFLIDESKRLYVYVVTDIDLKRTVLFVDDGDGSGEFESMKDELTVKTRKKSPTAELFRILAGPKPRKPKK